MLSPPLFVTISLNQWPKVLTRTLNLKLIHGRYKYNVSKTHFRKNRIKKASMSSENNQSEAVGTPSTSGNSNWDCNCSNIEKSNILSDNRTSQIDLNLINDIVITHPTMAVQQGVVPNVNNGINYCVPNMNIFHQISVQECVSSRYYSRERSAQRSRSLERMRDKDFLSRRRWENTDKKVNPKPGFIFTIMTYNVLAQDLLEQHPYLYQYHNKSCLDWNTRWHNLFKEIKKLNPDILCLQEVQESHIKDYFSLLETIGYGSLYKKRTGMRTEGCAVYYKTDMMNLVEYTTVEFYQRNISILNRDNVAIVAKFAPKMHPTREFVIATTHLLYNPRRQDVRLAQTQVLLSEVERISYNKKLQDSYLPIIITGDLNSTPDSALYEFLINGALNYEILAPKLLAKGTNTFGHGKVLIPPTLRITDNCQHADLVKKRRENSKITRSEELAIIKLINEDKLVDKIEEVVKEEKKLFSTGTLSHDFAFKSVYNHGDGNDEEGTTFQDEWCTVDYIFYSGRRNETKEKLKLLSRYRLPTRGELRDVRIPNSVLGSDHLSLMAKFKLEY